MLENLFPTRISCDPRTVQSISENLKNFTLIVRRFANTEQKMIWIIKI
jgi:hypothetical protein